MKLLWTGIKPIISTKSSYGNVINKLKDGNGNLTTDSAFKSFSFPSTPIFSELKILKLYDLFELQLLSFVCESVYMISPVFFQFFLKL